ncbi:phosphatidylserine/phosphatidylglycerophosphate/cardiolipin synthase family protein [Sphingomonas piscis]|uniref:Phospholipase D n=1 Tax=Sphingomonas piscis TaxID=2714943 RepID=A0A6G7YTB4_9SPHN|nr:phosphatidylserine/phosphatidylglycerophosphate/cardiolipin synthase family protein [Sphingomonas piscis]
MDGNALRLITSGKDRHRVILEMIGSAQHSVRLLFYMFVSDEAGTEVRDALLAAIRRGVKVDVLLDGFGSAGAEDGFFDALNDAGGKLCRFHPSYGRRYLLRNHQKLVVVDERRAIIGGANIHKDYLTDDGPGHWRDLWLTIDGPAVHCAANYFDLVDRWTVAKRPRLKDLRRLLARASQTEGPLQWKFSGPFMRRNAWHTIIAREISCGKSFDLISAYFSPPWAILRRIRKLGKRARILTAARSDNNATIAAARFTYARLLRRGVQMFEYRAAKLHTKLVIVDDAVHIGSSNFDFRSLYLNLEVMLRIEDADFAQRLRRYVDGELAQSEQITPEIHQRRGTFLRRMKWALSYFLVTSMDYTVTRRLNFQQEE